MKTVFLRCRFLWMAVVLCVTFFTVTTSRAEGQDVASAISNTDTNDVVHALCGKSVALLGEPPEHSFGETLDFKVEVVRRLVNECHFNALFIESGLYDYIHIEQAIASGQAVSDPMISAAIGGLWSNQEVQALVPFLTEKVRAGSLILGGLDDALGAGSWASHEMPSYLVEPLGTDERTRCGLILQKHMLWQYTAEAPYSPADKEKIVGCLSEIQAQLARTKQNSNSLDGRKVMLDSLQRSFARNFTEDDFTKKDQALKWANDRDHSMFLNYEWLRARLLRRSKIIVWAATVHTAKTLEGIQGFDGRVPLGSYIYEESKDKEYSIAFSAYSGEYAFIRQPVKKLDDAPSASLEAQVFAHTDTDTVYLSREQLRKYGSIEARPLGNVPKAARWDQIIDGLIIFRQEHAPTWIKPKVPRQ